MERVSVFSFDWVNIIGLIFVKIEDVYYDLFFIKFNNERMYVLVGVYLEFEFNNLLNCFLRNFIFCLKNVFECD